MSDPEADQDDIPSGQVCQKLCEEFASITGTDTACAQFFLQDRQWDLRRSLNAFFEAQDGEDDVKILEDGADREVIITASTLKKALDSARSDSIQNGTQNGPENEEIKNCKFITWNLDGIDEKSLKRRTKEVCRIIDTEMPDIVFFQEVVLDSLFYFKSHLLNYKVIEEKDEEYFTCTLLHKDRIEYESHEIIPFPGSIMGRSLLITKAKIKNIPILLVNSHFESTKDHKTERIRQLKTAFKYATEADKLYNVIFGGDLNLRDSELDVAGGVPSDMSDLWMATGSRPECTYTWDMTRNTNLSFPGRFMPRLRFDRVYLRPGKNALLNPKHFGLIGLERIKSCGRFPSDHWGIIIHFAL